MIALTQVHVDQLQALAQPGLPVPGTLTVDLEPDERFVDQRRRKLVLAA